MGNIAFGSKYFIFSKFSSIPKTSKVEAEREKLRNEYDELNTFSKSDELNNFLDLEKYVKSQHHEGILKKANTIISEEEGKEKKYESLKKSKAFKTFFKFRGSQKLKTHQEFAKSKELARYNELKEITASGDFQKELAKAEDFVAKAAEKEKRFAKLDKNKSVIKFVNSKNPADDKLEVTPIIKEYQKLKEELGSQAYATDKTHADKTLNNLKKQLQEFKKLQKSGDIKRYFKFEKSTKYNDFIAFEKSKELEDYFKLEEYLQSGEHKKQLDTARKQKEEEQKKIDEVNNFKNSKKYKWYLEVKDSNKFDVFRKWEIVFEDDFDSKKLNTEKWMTRYLWGDKLLDEPYVLDVNKAFLTDGSNLELSNSTIKITTRHESVTGKVWKPPYGFIPKEFNYTSGIISSGKSFASKYGKIEAKVRINHAKPVDFNFWMTSANHQSHIDILKLDKKKSKVAMSNITAADGKNTTVTKSEYSGLDLAQDFFIYTLEWTKEKLVWKINGVLVNEQTSNIPKEDLYIIFNSRITKEIKESSLSAAMEIDWVRWYQPVN